MSDGPNLRNIMETWQRVQEQLSQAKDVRDTMAEPVPLHLRNAVTRSMKEWGYGEGYKHAHKFEDAVTDMECRPASLAGHRYYFPTNRGSEKRIAERMEQLRKRTEPPSETPSETE